MPRPALATLSCLLAVLLQAPSPAAAPRPGAALTVVSINVAMKEDPDRLAAELEAAGARDADVLLLQEVAGRDGRSDITEALARQLGLHAVYEPAFDDGGRTVGLATLSRYPVSAARVLALERVDLHVRTRDRIALAVELDAPGGPLRTYNLHLDTRINTGDRLKQLAGVMRDATSSDGRALVAGDFNTNPHLWLFHLVPLPFLGRQATGVERFMSSNGFASAFDDGATHDALGMRLDWVFVRGLDVSAASIHPLSVSDHHALLVSVRGR